MSARLLIKKYTGKDGDFGTPVSSIGLKRVDTCVPSVYSSAALESSGTTVPADDASEAGAYCIYRPDNPECYSYSMESVFKIHLIKAPDVQLSNIRLYPIGERPKLQTAAKLYIGNSISYSRPTDQKSQIALNDIWNYSKEHPFYLTVAGLYGQVPDPRLSQDYYTVEYKDCGFGNLIYINGDRQPTLTVASRVRGDETIVYTFENKSGFALDNFIEFVKLDGTKPTTEQAVPLREPYVYHPAVCDENGKATSVVDMTRICLVVRDPAQGLDLIQECPYGLIYKRPADEHSSNFGTGGEIQVAYLYNGIPGTYGEDNPAYVPTEWHNTVINASTGEVTTNDDVESPFVDPQDAIIQDKKVAKPLYKFDVEVEQDNFGHNCYVMNGVRRPMLTFDLNALYAFRNRAGATCPLRFIGNPFSPIANVIDDVVVDGVTVFNGATNDEIVYVDPEAVFKAGKKINAYQCVTMLEMGSYVHNAPLCMCGNYNLCRVDGGIYNPLKAGETDYVYLQLEVNGNSEPGYCVPDIEIEYDEN